MTAESDLEKILNGVSVVTPSFFSVNNELDGAGFAQHLAALDLHGFGNIVIGGLVGEFHALADSEIKELYVIAGERVGQTPLVCSVGGSVKRIERHCDYAVEAGAACVMLHEPVEGNVSESGLVRYIREAAALSSLPVVVYARSLAMSSRVLAEVVDGQTIVGVKDSRNDLPAFAADSQSEGIWICGTAELWAPFYFAAGARGFTSGLANVAPDMSTDLFHALLANDVEVSARLLRLIRPFENLRARKNGSLNVAVVKYALERQGHGTAVVRPPLGDLSREERRSVDDMLKSWASERMAMSRD